MQSEKILELRTLTLFGMFTFFRFEQFQKALFPICEIESGRCISCKEAIPLNAPFAIATTFESLYVEGTVISVAVHLSFNL